jgi:hypothetical protein
MSKQASSTAIQDFSATTLFTDDSADSLVEFSEWMESQLLELEDRFRGFWTSRSVMGSLGRRSS